MLISNMHSVNPLDHLLIMKSLLWIYAYKLVYVAALPFVTMEEARECEQEKSLKGY